MICTHCEADFNHKSAAKVKAGGKINECPDCVEELNTETTVKYLGVCMGEGKQGGVDILAFESDADRDAYKKMWRNNSGQNKSKNCQLGNHLTPSSGFKFRKVAENHGNRNHKGRAD